jgi:hypothetical protein
MATMAIDHTYTETIERDELRLPAGGFIARGVQRHVAFVVLEQLLQETNDPQVTVSLTVRREDYTDELCSFTATGRVVAAHA